MTRRVFIALKMAGIAGRDKLEGIFRYLGERTDWDITLIRTAAEFTPERVRNALAEKYDGFIVSIPDTEPSAALLANTSVPTIVMDIHDPSLSARRRNITFIRNSPKVIGEAAADFLLSTGRCRSYAFVHSQSVMEWASERAKSFRRTLADRGIWTEELDSPAGLASLERPIGVFAANDDRGYETLEWCRKNHISVPKDAIVIGTNNDTLICENCHPRLTSIQPDFEKEGYLAAETLDRMMSTRHRRGKRAETDAATIYVGIKGICRRESTADLSQAGKLVQKALTFIRKNSMRDIGVEDVARHAGCSRRLIDLRFRELMGTTIGETIICERLKNVQRLLASTTDTIEQIANDCGYESPNYLRNLFKRRFGQSMSEWRLSLGGKSTAISRGAKGRRRP